VRRQARFGQIPGVKTFHEKATSVIKYARFDDHDARQARVNNVDQESVRDKVRKRIEEGYLKAL